MNIIEMDIDKVIPYENNPRKNDEAVDKVALSISAFGFKVPIVLDANNVVVTGHTRLKAAKKLGLSKVPCILADDLTEEQIRAFRLADNKVAEFSQWDEDKLMQELEELENVDMSLYGFDELEAEVEELNIVEDEVVEEVEPRAKIGDIYKLGRHRLICGDSTDVAVIDRLMDGVKVDMVFTDPPYGNGTSGKYGRGQLGVRTIAGDEDLSAFNDFVSIMNTDKMVYFLQWRTLGESLETIRNKGLKVNTVAVWDKKNAGLNGGGGISEQWEAVIFAGNIKYKKFGGNVFSIAREQHKREDSPHPHQKPIKLLAEIFDFVDECKIVLDPFGGSGSTLIACEQLNRTCYMAELDERYVSVIVNRWLNFTGRKDEIFCIRDGQKLTYDEVFN